MVFLRRHNVDGDNAVASASGRRNRMRKHDQPLLAGVQTHAVEVRLRFRFLPASPV